MWHGDCPLVALRAKTKENVRTMKETFPHREPSGARKRTPRDADPELLHLESVLAAVSRSACLSPLGPAYWKARVHDIRGQYALLASQTNRLAVLEREIDALETRNCDKFILIYDGTSPGTGRHQSERWPLRPRSPVSSSALNAVNPSPELNTIPKQLRLSGILDSLEQRNREAIDGQLAYTEFLAMLLQDEVARREQKKLGARLARAGFALGKTLETFNFDRLPKLNRAHFHDLATGRYIDEKVCVLMVGQTGVSRI
jgi:hypothetical protein